MPRPRVTMHKIREILRLLDEGLSRRQISDALAIPRTTVGEYATRAKLASLSWPLPDDLDDDALQAKLFATPPPSGTARPVPEWAVVHLELRRKGMTLMLSWHEYRAEHPDGYAYTQFCEHYRRFCGTLNPTMRLTHVMGEKMFIDFSGVTVPLWHHGAVAGHAEVFVAALGGSSLLYVEALPSQELIHFIGAHTRAFDYYGGVPALLVPDNLKSAVTTPDRYEPLPNATYLEMASHYGTAILPTRVRKPRDKAKVEVGVQVVERWILAPLRHERFESVDEVNLAIAPLLERVNERPMRGLNESRRALFERLERKELRAMPANRYEFATWRQAKVAIDYHVEVRSDRHFYSVPSRLVGAHVDLRLGEKTVAIFHRHQLVASHVRCRQPGFSTDPAHMPESHRRYAQWTPQRITNWAEKTGPATAQLTTNIMRERPHPEQGFRSCLGIIRLEKTFGATRLEAASARALALHSHSFKTVQSILKKNLDARPLRVEPLRPYSVHDNVRGANYYQ